MYLLAIIKNKIILSKDSYPVDYLLLGNNKIFEKLICKKYSV